MKLWVGHDARTHKRTNENTHARTDRVNSRCPSAILWWGIKALYSEGYFILDIYEAAIPSFFFFFFFFYYYLLKMLRRFNLKIRLI